MPDNFFVIDDHLPAGGEQDVSEEALPAAREAEILRSGLHILNYAHSTDVLYEGILSVLTKIVPFSDAAILMPTDGGGFETVVTHAGKLDLQLALTEGAFADIMDGQAILAPDLDELEGWAEASERSTATFKSGLIMPLESAERPAVIVCVQVDEPFNDDHLRALKTFAPLAAQAVQWAVKRQEMEQHREHLEELVRERTEELAEQKEQLADALEAQLELSGLQRQFVSMVCHEFRTPLAIIDGNAQRVSRKYDAIEPDRLLSNIDKIRNAVVRLTNLIESVLDAARLEAGRLKFEPEPFNLESLIDEACSNHRELNPGYKIFSETVGFEGEVQGDLKLMRQVMSNLLSNAVKYSPEGTQVWVRAAVFEDDSFTISVRDDGVGIPEEEHEKLFDRFYRGSSSTGIVGTGIGLHLVQTLVELHGGRIEVESAVGEGSTFTLIMPRVPNAASDQARDEGEGTSTAA